MTERNHRRTGGWTNWRKRCATATMIMALGGLSAGTVGCDEDATARAFRDAAAGSLESGLKAIFDGIVEGAFAAFEIGTDQSDSGGETETPE